MTNDFCTFNQCSPKHVAPFPRFRILLEIQEHSKGLSFDISGFINTETNKTLNLYKFLTGRFWGWLIIALSPLIYKKKIKDMFIAVLIFTLLGTFLGWVSMQIPTFINPLYNYIGFPVLQLAIGIVIGIMVSQKKRKDCQCRLTSEFPKSEKI